MFLQKPSENPTGGQGSDEWTPVGGTGAECSGYSLQGARLYDYSSWWSLQGWLHDKLSQPPLADRPTYT